MKVYNTTNLVNHLKSTHNKAYTEHQENEKKKKQEKELAAITNGSTRQKS